VFNPNTLKNTKMTNLFTELGINIVFLNKRQELPQIAKDFIRSFSIKNLKSIKEVSSRIKSFNYNMVRKLEEMENPGARSENKEKYMEKKNIEKMLKIRK
jgi:hypothetical protein